MDSDERNFWKRYKKSHEEMGKKTFKSHLKSKDGTILNYPNKGLKSFQRNIAQFHVIAARSAFCKIIIFSCYVYT